ncbi:hydroxymethylbilane synthase [Tenuibacillus multivorans]|uniref:Porphobilinogen deaminase n=1 Tax=Tenuibacillus multivorans TaxID=237069 RepID=A0A1G9ZM37_9BACI|nr:hydroxymethylbilane synthase [Tenuibacillus multivorans]GEL77441.1 porphobilinogen deaminase [Tenuibacillus multivorans]SDN22388.1 hydroxymethylbilane synthase [Tenuibacillus multivorans]
MRKIVIGSRRSNLAMTQTEWVIDQLKKHTDQYEFEIKKIVTKGDKIQNVTLSKVGGKGLFVKEIEQAMYGHEIDMAVHSMKDMPSQMPDGLKIACVPEREDHRDAFISNDHVKLKDLPDGAVIGTSSLRRGAQILAYRPDLNIQWIRGNIETRLRKLKEENYDAIVLAAAGMKRMGWSTELVTEFLEPEVCLPAVGQGALAIECREDDQELVDLLNEINHEYTETTVAAERKFLGMLEGSCQVPIAGYAVREGDEIVLDALVSSPDGNVLLQTQKRSKDPIQAGEDAANELIKQGAKDLVDEAKRELDER